VTENVVPAQWLEVEPALADRETEFRTLFQAEFGYVWKTLRRLGVAERDVPDVAHDLFIAVYRRLGEFDHARPARPWLSGFAVRFAADYKRLARNRYEQVDADAGEAERADASADGALRALEARDLVLKALDGLSFERRTVLVLHDIDGYAMPEVAEALGIPLNTAYSRLRLARTDFRDTVETIRRAQVPHA
jgi:RNA polymerase sigma-70 factor (ECF subfamily)